MDTFEILNSEFSSQSFANEPPQTEILDRYRDIACNYARMENAIAVLSDLRSSTSHIYYGGFSRMLGIGCNRKDSRLPSIWEEEIFNLLHPDDLAG